MTAARKIDVTPRNPGRRAPLDTVRAAIIEHDELLALNLTAKSRRRVEAARVRAWTIIATRTGGEFPGECVFCGTYSDRCLPETPTDLPMCPSCYE